MAAPKTVATYDLNGSTREFDFAFDYLARSFVKVSLIGTERVVLQVGTDYTFVSANRIRTNVIYGAPDYQQIEIRRETSTTDRLVDFQDASILRADDLDLSQLQVLHVAEEAREAATETIGVNNAGELDARGRRIVNVAAPRPGTNDAVSIGFYQSDVNGVFQAKAAAESARDAAQASQTSAASSASAANTSRTQAASSATAAAGSATTASTKASEASASAVSAGVSKADSTTNAQLAYKWAQNPENEVVNGGMFSSFHWAKKSEAWANAAATSVLPNGSVSYEKMNSDLQTGRWVSKSGDEMTGNLSMKAGVVLRHTGGTGVASYSINLQSYEGAVVNSWMVGVGAGVEIRHGSNNNSGRIVRFDGTAKSLYVYGDIYTQTNKLVAKKEEVDSVSARVTALEQVRYAETTLAGKTSAEISIPSTARNIRVYVTGLRKSAAYHSVLQLGGGSTFVTSGYSAFMASYSGNAAAGSFTTDAGLPVLYDANFVTGEYSMRKDATGKWSGFGVCAGRTGYGTIAQSIPLTIATPTTKIRLISVPGAGATTFTDGAMRVEWD